MLPEKHPSVANAHSRFVELNNSFVTVGLSGLEIVGPIKLIENCIAIMRVKRYNILTLYDCLLL